MSRRLRAGGGRGGVAGSWLPCTHRIIPTDRETYDVQQGRWRVATSAHLYEFRTPDDAEVEAVRWHPAGKSYATFPHLHLYTVCTGGFAVVSRPAAADHR